MRISKSVLTVCGLILFGTVVGVGAQGSSPIRACVGPAGAMRILVSDGSCKTNETPLVWTASGLAAPQEPAGVPAPAGLRVVNALGQDLGPLLDASTVVLTLPSGRKTYAELFPAGPPAGWLVTQYYQSGDCTGEAFVFWNMLEELVPPALVRQGGVWATKPGTIASRLMKSYRQYGDTGGLNCVAYSGALVTTAFDFYQQPADLGIVYPLAVQ